MWLQRRHSYPHLMVDQAAHKVTQGSHQLIQIRHLSCCFWQARGRTKCCQPRDSQALIPTLSALGLFQKIYITSSKKEKIWKTSQLPHESISEEHEKGQKRGGDRDKGRHWEIGKSEHLNATFWWNGHYVSLSLFYVICVVVIIVSSSFWYHSIPVAQVKGRGDLWWIMEISEEHGHIPDYLLNFHLLPLRPVQVLFNAFFGWLFRGCKSQAVSIRHHLRRQNSCPLTIQYGRRI